MESGEKPNLTVGTSIGVIYLFFVSLPMHPFGDMDVNETVNESTF